MAQVKNQSDSRRNVHPVDQFHRMWFGSIETATGDFCSLIRPASPAGRPSWVDPLRTPQAYLQMPKDESGYGQLGKIEVQFDRWITQLEADEVEWYKQLHVVALTVYKRVDPVDVPHLENDAFVRDLTGPKPWPSSVVVKAAQGGDRQYLGLEPLDTEHMKALGLVAAADVRTFVENAPQAVAAPAAATSEFPPIPETYQEFVSWDIKYGGAKNLTEAAAHWKAHRANLAAK